MTSFAVGTVGYMLTMMHGVWHDHITLCEMDGTPIANDIYGGADGSAPFDNLVYVDFDGENYRQTNVTFNGRPLHVRSFTGRLIDGILHFDKLGEGDPGHIGVAVAHNVLAFMPSQVSDALRNYTEPDFIFFPAPYQRIRATVLYRHTKPVRNLHAQGVKLSPIANVRHAVDPRGLDGAVHQERSVTDVYQK